MNTNKSRLRTEESNRPLTILLAEDDLEMRKLLSWSLAREGYRIIECADGISLMKKLGLFGPEGRIQAHDLIISDIRMPGLTGLQVLESVREFPDFPPIILITAFPDTASRDQALRLGAVAMLAKPFDIQDLIDTVHAALPDESDDVRRRIEERNMDFGSPFPLEITFRHDSGSEAAKEYIYDVASKLYPFADHILNGKIIVDHADKVEHKEHRYTIHLVLSTPGKSIIVKYGPDKGGSGGNLYLALNIVFGTAARKLKHYIKKRNDVRKRGASKIRFREMDENDEQSDTDMD